MKLRIIPILLAILLLLTGCGILRSLDTAEDRIEDRFDQAEDRLEQQLEQPNSFASPTPDQIDEAEAIDIALRHAGRTAEQVDSLYASYEIDDGIPQYDISFYVGNMKYEYEINADTGDILTFDVDN